MNYSKINSILSSLRIKRLEIERLKNKVKVLGDSLGYKSPTYEERVQSSLLTNLTEEENYVFLEIKQECQKKMLALEFEITQWEKLIGKMKNLNQAHVLKYYYFDGLPLYEIADNLGYEYGYVRKLKVRGVNQLLNLYNLQEQTAKNEIRNKKEQ